jgi:hypothetical protein
LNYRNIRQTDAAEEDRETPLKVERSCKQPEREIETEFRRCKSCIRASHQQLEHTVLLQSASCVAPSASIFRKTKSGVRVYVLYSKIKSTTAEQKHVVFCGHLGKILVKYKQLNGDQMLCGGI